jgi:hypothetical protein
VNGDNPDSTDAAVDALKQAFAESALPPARPIERAYRPIGELTHWLVGLVVAQLVAASVGVVATLVMRSSGSEPFGAAAITSIGAALIEAVGYIAALVVFCVWVHQAYSNLVPLGSRRVRFTPGWAVGYFFIPLVNLVRGLQVMRDLWIESQPLPIEGAAQGTLVRRALLVGWWWAMWILTTTSLRIGHTSSRILVWDNDPMTKYVLNAITGVLFIAVLRGIARRQRDQWDDMVRRQPVPPAKDQLR